MDSCHVGWKHWSNLRIPLNIAVARSIATQTDYPKYRRGQRATATLLDRTWIVFPVESVLSVLRCRTSGRDWSEMWTMYFRWWYIMCSEKNSTRWVRVLQLQGPSKQDETKGDSIYWVRVPRRVLHHLVPLRLKEISTMTQNSALQLVRVQSQQIVLLFSVRWGKWASAVGTCLDQISWSSIPKGSCVRCSWRMWTFLQWSDGWRLRRIPVKLNYSFRARLLDTTGDSEIGCTWKMVSCTTGGTSRLGSVPCWWLPSHYARNSSACFITHTQLVTWVGIRACCRNMLVRKTPKAPLENYQAGSDPYGPARTILRECLW